MGTWVAKHLHWGVSKPGTPILFCWFLLLTDFLSRWLFSEIFIPPLKNIFSVNEYRGNSCFACFRLEVGTPKCILHTANFSHLLHIDHVFSLSFLCGIKSYNNNANYWGMGNKQFVVLYHRGNHYHNSKRYKLIWMEFYSQGIYEGEMLQAMHFISFWWNLLNIYDRERWRGWRER